MQVYRNDVAVFEINPDAQSNHVKRVMGENVLNIIFQSVAPVTFQIGDKVNFEGESFWLNQLPVSKQISTRQYEYTCVFEGIEYELAKVIYKLFEITETPPQSEFPLTGNAQTFVQLLVDNMNLFGEGWTVGEVVDSTYRTMSFSNEDCSAVLARLAQEFDTEFWVTATKQVNLTKRVLAIDPPELEYGKGKGLKEVLRANRDDSNIITVLYPYGSERNIKAGYRDGSKRLLIPSAVLLTQNQGLYGHIEGVKFFDDIYPRLNAGLGENEPGKVTAVDGLLKFQDSNLDFNVNNQLLPGITAKVVFNTGQLAGQEFEISAFNNTTKEYTIIPNNFEDAGELPVPGIQAATGDEYVLIDVDMPAAYVTRAENELLAKATAYLEENSSPRDAITVICDVLYLKSEDINFAIGQMVHVIATPLGINREIRVTGYTRNVREIYDYRLELADTVSIGKLDRIEAEVSNNEKNITVTSERDRMFTARSFRSVKESIDMIYDPEGDFFTENIQPLVVQTVQLVVGTESQQFDFIGLRFRPNYEGNPNDFRWTAGSLEHASLEETWNIAAGQLPALTSGTAYYIYARCEKDGNNGTIVQSAVSIQTDSDPDYYHFWIGVLNSVVDNNRSWQPMHGFTEIAGQYITTGVIKSSDGLTYFDLNNGEIGGRIVFNNGTKTLEELGTENADLKDYIDNVLPTILDGFQDQLDGVIEQFFEEYDPTLLNEPAVSWNTTQLQEDHLGDLFYNTLTGKVFRWVKSGSNYFWQELQDNEVAEALALANQALSLAGTKRRIFVAQPTTPYEVADLWVQGTGGDIMRCQTARASGSFQSGDWVKASKYTDDSAVTTLIGNLKGMAYEELVTLAKLDNTIIEGGYIKTSLIDVDTLIVSGSIETIAGSTSKANSAQVTAIAHAAADATTKMNTALDAAATAQSSANTANTLLADIASDNKLTPDEKQSTKKEWDIIVSEKVKIDSSADNYGVSKTAYTNAYNTLSTYITPLLSNLTTTSNITGTTFRTNFKNYYDARQDILNAISNAAKNLANNAQNAVNNLINNLGNLAYDDMVSLAKLDSTIIQGGYIKTTLIDVNTLIAKHVLTSSSGRRVHIDGNNNTLKMYNSAGQQVFSCHQIMSGSTDIGFYQTIRNPSQTSLISDDAVRMGYDGALIVGSGVGLILSGLPEFINCSIMGITEKRDATVAGKVSAGIVGLDRSVTGVGRSFGGYFDTIFAGGTHFGNRRYTTNSNLTLTSTDTWITFLQTSSITCFLPSNPLPGRTIFAKRNGSGGVTFNGNGKLIYLNENSTSTAPIFGDRGNGVMLVYDGVAWQYFQLPRYL